MSSAIQAVEADRAALLKILSELHDSDWARASGCPGWSVRDVVSHMACSFWLAVDPSHLPDPGGLPAERAADLYVESRRSMTSREIVDDYESVSSKGLEVLAAAEGQDFEVPLGDVGTYPASVIPTAFAFEHYVHIRHDLLQPHGPLQAEPPACDGLRLEPTVDWIEAALPQQNAALLGRIDDAVEIRLTGGCARTLRFGEGDVTAQITSDADAFVRWISQRGNWEALGVQAEGDRANLEIVRQLSVF
ncbi:maleylpyruvate isomerase family mycothiol-dependent enzyme [Mycobacterium sp. E2699]|uniref:maleylpyruvate isomerase family mycothiol-dependent enzyme n=1 Tax=Mycobacterium sp. E2699 TaxID=1834137 RepID=UPI0009EEEB3F|nr:maleylpyruvate isomerase family mycothiol-dependent enzyme [Mycobacterium sp. E2699]